MKSLLKIVLLLLVPAFADSQLDNIDSLKNRLQKASEEEERFMIVRLVYSYYEELNRDSALYYAEQGLLIAKKDHHNLAQGLSLITMAYQLIGMGKFGEAHQCLLQAFAIAEDKKNEGDEWKLSTLNFTGNKRLFILSYSHHIFAILMGRTNNSQQEIFHYKKADSIGRLINFVPRIMLANMNLGASYLSINKLDSALYFEKEAERVMLQSEFQKYLGFVYVIMGDIYKTSRSEQLSLQYYYRGLKAAIDNDNRSTMSRIYLRLNRHHLTAGNKDSTLYYAKKNLQTIESLGLVTGNENNIGIGYEYLYLSYKLNRQFDSAFKYQGLALTAKDSLNKAHITNLAAFQSLTLSEQLRLENLEKEKVVYQNKIRTYFMLAGIGVLLLLAIIFYRNNRQKHKAKIKIEKAYDDLKATQQQLIQSEKMASLGELTAGIAHEIQNPLNFVNNFSEVNKELLAELKHEMKQGNLNEANSIADDVINNHEKINHHGKRADAIVKGMLQHSRTSGGQKELTDINALSGEYSRLAYHGFKAKDKLFNAILKTDLDSSVEKINVVPQEIGKVLFNLVNNAFYEVSEKVRQNIAGYVPTVTISTKKAADKVELRVTDNGPGIPQKILDKIFQPFFTTKPTGQGTGLGLSLSYDTVKAHGGELRVETKEGEGSEFIISLPG